MAVKNYRVYILALLFSVFIPSILYILQERSIDLRLDEKPTFSYPANVKYSYRWVKGPALARQQARGADVGPMDQKYCGKDRCQFILPVFIGEQESKGQMHFRQLAFLAKKLGRTIVLPNVHRSHLGACLEHPFSFYYDDQRWLELNEGYVDAIRMQDFQSWLAERKAAEAVPSAQEIYIQGIERSKLLYKKKNCFRDSFDFTDRPTVDYQLLDARGKGKNITHTLARLLSNEARAYEYLGASDTPVDVIHLYYDRRFKFLDGDRVQKPIPYSPRLVNRAQAIAAELKPFVAIHWRMEELEAVKNLVPCAQDLVDKVKKLDVQHVFLLTDYPHLLSTPGAKPESSSFHPNALRPAHHRAIRYVYRQLNVTLTASDRSLPILPWRLLPVATGNDSGVLGIVDKLVAERAQYFLAGRPGVCAKSSSFTGGISLYREQAAQQGKKDIIAPLQMFDLPHD
ncbi:hypothetical protein BY458DRAFT_508416 [Sporodiniella umbellata]|nr:hypothetical protein BY458DRAFT_508416 [Sporodiniella umbellata]